MPQEKENLNPVDFYKIRTAIIQHTPIEITTYTLPRNMEVYMQETLANFLKVCNQEPMTEYLSFCLGELLTNAKKANTKRVYFKEKNLDINNESDYEKGMESFRDDTFSDIEHYLELQKKEGLYIKLILQLESNYFKIEIRNNAKLTVFEEKRIREKLASAHKYSSVEEVLTEILDQTEGSGLGIIIMILMLQKVGLSESNYQVLSTDEETITRIILPMRGNRKDLFMSLSNKFCESCKTLPVLQEELDIIQNVLTFPDAKKSDVLYRIARDPGLTLVFLREVNKISSCFNLEKGLELIEIEDLRTLFSKDNPNIFVIEKTEFNFKRMRHMVCVAFFAYNIAANFCADKNYDYNEIYLLGMLHDMTEMLMQNISEEQKNLLSSFAMENNIDRGTLEAFEHFAFHDKCAKVFADTWNFPEMVGQVFESHHDSSFAPENLKDIVRIVEFAEEIALYNEHAIEFYQIGEDLLKDYKIETEDRLNYLLSNLNEEFEKYYDKQL